jgi:hypothetical protein
LASGLAGIEIEGLFEFVWPNGHVFIKVAARWMLRSSVRQFRFSEIREEGSSGEPEEFADLAGGFVGVAIKDARLLQLGVMGT